MMMMMMMYVVCMYVKSSLVVVDVCLFHYSLQPRWGRDTEKKKKKKIVS